MDPSAFTFSGFSTTHRRLYGSRFRLARNGLDFPPISLFHNGAAIKRACKNSHGSYVGGRWAVRNAYAEYMNIAGARPRARCRERTHHLTKVPIIRPTSVGAASDECGVVSREGRALLMEARSWSSRLQVSPQRVPASKAIAQKYDLCKDKALGSTRCPERSKQVRRP